MHIDKIESSFNEEKFKSKVNNIFILLMSSVMNKDIKRVDHFISDEVYNQYNKIIQELINNKEIQIYDQLNVKKIEIKDKTIDDDKEVITVEIILRAIDYLLNEFNEVISGNDTIRVEKKYILVFEKNIDSLQQNIVRHCPSCGANMDINYSGECKYCGSIYNYEDYEWILTQIKTV